MASGTVQASTTIYPLFLNIFLFPELIDGFYLFPGESTDGLRLTEILKSLFFEISDSPRQQMPADISYLTPNGRDSVYRRQHFIINHRFRIQCLTQRCKVRIVQ